MADQGDQQQRRGRVCDGAARASDAPVQEARRPGQEQGQAQMPPPSIVDAQSVSTVSNTSSTTERKRKSTPKQKDPEPATPFADVNLPEIEQYQKLYGRNLSAFPAKKPEIIVPETNLVGDEEPAAKRTKNNASEKSDESTAVHTKIRDTAPEDDCDKPLPSLVGHPIDSVLKKHIADIVDQKGLESIIINGVIQKIFNMYPKIDLSYRKEFIKQTIRSMLGKSDVKEVKSTFEKEASDITDQDDHAAVFAATMVCKCSYKRSCLCHFNEDERNQMVKMREKILFHVSKFKGYVQGIIDPPPPSEKSFVSAEMRDELRKQVKWMEKEFVSKFEQIGDKSVDSVSTAVEVLGYDKVSDKNLSAEPLRIEMAQDHNTLVKATKESFLG